MRLKHGTTYYIFSDLADCLTLALASTEAWQRPTVSRTFPTIIFLIFKEFYKFVTYNPWIYLHKGKLHSICAYHL